MASPFDDDGQVDDDEFFDYNPHPYGGGYDISATYGAPLPPSPSTCYQPISAPANVPAPPVPAPAPAPSMPRSPIPQDPPARKPPPSPTPIPTPTPAPVPAEPYYHWPKPHDYGDAPRWGPTYYATPEVFRGWPYLPPPTGPRCCRSSRCVPRDYWRQCMRGLDYLFGHADGYGERRIGVDCHGVPVYANKKGAVEDAVVVEVPPPVTGHVQWHEPGEALPPDQSNQSSWEYDDAKEDTYATAQPTYDTSYGQSYSDHGLSDEPPTLSWYGSANVDAYAYAQPTYDTSYQQSYSVHGISDESSWFPNQSYQDVYKEQESQYQEVLSSYGAENTISAQPIYCYNQHFSEQPLHIEVEPPETVYSHKLEYHENFSAYTDQTNTDNLETSTPSCEIQPYVYVPDVPLEPYQPSWSRNLGYYQACTEEVAPKYDNHALDSGEYGDMASLFPCSSYPKPVEVYEQSYSDEYVSLQQNFQSNWNIFSEDTSQITRSGDDCNYPNGSFWPFG
ncbi:uncharacterized protein LOC100825692 isoform X3 [Brachypodium distachyon]|uniref:Uncharacterized protein n=1 Tax=Brachypodium distachyon TaxID=15368 RepID=I1GR25_BRADI|nr:uncharacterized protein LOC100825692 isoform X3 [Brachypodium distachyon]KQK14594.1 hypothetical protein BRADI_1g17500v3 [Brachypodium distachyon]|eukprot:XP_010233812.1 uncharacterized protein LOC100825692 isoform X3 [Brachypodium distachyon]